MVTQTIKHSLYSEPSQRMGSLLTKRGFFLWWDKFGTSTISISLLEKARRI
jgi:hypothetical protein